MELNKGNIIDLRIILLGDENVGKKSICQRMKILKSTETKEIPLNEFKKRNIFKNTRMKDLMKDNSNLDNEEKMFINKEKKRMNYMRFTKIFRMELNNLQISFYPCSEAEMIDYDYEPKNDEDNEFEKEYKMSIKNMLTEIQEIIMRPSDEPKANVEILFLLCFDLSDFSTLENLLIFFSQINKKFKLTENDFKLSLIGTKIDIKKTMNNEQKVNFENFKNQLGAPYYEISSLNFYKFENFFEKLILDNYSDIYPIFSNERIKTVFHNILHTQNDFTKKKRDNFEVKSDVPGADVYNNNVYEYPKSKKELLKIFSRRNIFNKKIFINKQGMLFPPIKDVKDKLHSEENENKTEKQLKGQYFNVNWDSIRNEKVQEALELNSNKPGYSLGTKTNNSLGLRKEREQLRSLRDKEILNKLDGYIISGSQVLPIKPFRTCMSQKQYQDKYEKNRLVKRKKKSEERQEINDMLKQRHEDMKLKNSRSFDKKIFEINERQKKYDIINLNKILEREKERKEREKEKKNKYNTIQTGKSYSMKYLEPKGKFYSPISSISTNKGFTFGLKLPIKAEQKDDPEYPTFQDDFEKLIEKNKKRGEIKSYGERLPVYKTEEIGDSSYVMEKQKDFEKKRKKFRKHLFSDFFENRKDRKEYVINQKKAIFESQQQKLKEQIQKVYKTDENYLLRDINYNQIEYSFPKYTIKGKPRGTLFSNTNSDDEYFGNKRFATISGKETNYKTKLISENFGAIYPRYPAFSFGSAKRFDYSSDNKINDNKISDNKNEEKNKSIPRYDYDIFKSYQDTQSFLMAQTSMGTGEKLKMEINGYPGPGMYNIKGFADDVLSKGSKINLTRLQIRKKEKFYEIEKERREKLREQWKEEKKSQLKMGIRDYYNLKINKKNNEEQNFVSEEIDND